MNSYFNTKNKCFKCGERIKINAAANIASGVCIYFRICAGIFCKGCQVLAGSINSQCFNKFNLLKKGDQFEF